jgi:GNAT superfamily N-acetyltransferase
LDTQGSIGYSIIQYPFAGAIAISNIEYRRMARGEEGAALDLWTDMYEGTRRDAWQRELRCDPKYLEHTFIAVETTGNVLSTCHYWLKEIRDSTGQPHLTGCVSHVATHPNARRRGHAGRLLEMTIEAMERDGCRWSLLFATEEGRSLYERLGWRVLHTPFREGILSGERPDGGSAYAIRRYDPFTEPGGWGPLANVYAAYNIRRPLTVVRDADYWREYIRVKTHGWAVFLVAEPSPNEKEIDAYLLSHFSERGFLVNEMAVLPGHEDAIPALFAAVVDRAQGGDTRGRLFLPYEPEIDATIECIFGGKVSTQESNEPMVRPVSPGFSHDRIEALFRSKGAIYWPMDEF